MRMTNLRWEPADRTVSVGSFAIRAVEAVSTLANVETVREERVVLEPALNPRDAAIFLLHVAAEIEHALMAQYLYAAWSLGGDQVPPASDDANKNLVEGWRKDILEIAREEMAHLITVQNLLLLLGGPITLEREDYPFRSDLYPFEFKLHRLDRRSLARYIAAEMPRLETLAPSDQAILRDKVLPLATNGGAMPVNRVGALYSAIIDLFQKKESDADPSLHLADKDFLSGIDIYQAKAEDWGFGPAVMVDAVTDRDSALKALIGIAEQGEGPTVPMPDYSTSHFGKFLAIFKSLDKVEWEPSRPSVPESPTTTPGTKGTYIADATARDWAYLFNLRYRLLLGFLHHFLLIPGSLFDASGDRTPRGLLQLYTFREMRRLSKIGRRLMGQTLWMAGPPFELPYSLNLPGRDQDRWRLLADIFDANTTLLRKMLPTAIGPDADFLNYVLQEDTEAHANVLAIAAGQPTVQPTNFRKVVTILDEAVHGFHIEKHGAFWSDKTRDEFVVYSVFGAYPLMARKPDNTFDGPNSNLVKVLRGTHEDIPQMPLNRQPIRKERIDFIEYWIEHNQCADNDPPGKIGIEQEPTPKPAPTIAPAKRFSEITKILEEAVGGDTIGFHGNFWRGKTRDAFVVYPVYGLPLIVKKADGTYDPDESNLIKSLEGRAPFGNDLTPPTPGANKPRMPAFRDAVPPEKIAVIRKWIVDGCPDDET